MAVRAYPLQWPRGWPRTKAKDLKDSRARFRRGSGQEWTLEGARAALLGELDRLGAVGHIISSNMGGLGTRPEDQGIAIYFELKGKPMVMAQDAHTRAEENMRSLTLAIEAMRQLERHGGGVMMERAFTGFEALPKPNGGGTDLIAMTSDAARQVLGVAAKATEAAIKKAFAEKAKHAHADTGGSDAQMRVLLAARDLLLEDEA